MQAPLAKSAPLFGTYLASGADGDGISGGGGGSGGGTTLTLEITVGPGVNSGQAGQFTATLSGVLASDLELTVSTDQGAAEVVSPQTIAAGNLQKTVFVANTGGYAGTVNVTVTTDNPAVTVVNSPLQFEFASE